MKSLVVVGGGSSGIFYEEIANAINRQGRVWREIIVSPDMASDERFVTETNRYVVAIAWPEKRQRIAQRFHIEHAAVLVHPTAVVGPGASLGAGSVIGPFAVIGPGAHVGIHASINVGASIAQGSVLGNYCTLSPGARVSGGNAIGDGLFLGANAATRDHVLIGNWVTVGCGAAVINDTPDGVTVGGVPAHELHGAGRVVGPME